MNVKQIIFILLGYFVIPQTGSAQCNEWSWPENRTLAEEKVALFQDALREKKYEQARATFNWIIKNASSPHSSFYIQGITLYDALATKEKDAKRKKVYVDSLLLVYDLRITNCGEEEKILWRKALSAFKFLINGGEANRVLPIMDRVYREFPGSVTEDLWLPYIQAIVINHQKFKTPDQDGILERYEVLTQMADKKIGLAKEPKQKAKLVKLRKDIDDWLFKVVKPDCEFVKANLEERFHQNRSDLVLAQRVFTYMLHGKCTDDPLWLESGQVIFESQRDFGLGKAIATRFLAIKNTAEAERYFNESLPLAPSKSDSSEVIYYKGIIEAEKGDKLKAREYFIQSYGLDPTRKDACVRIGDLYMNSFEQCAKRERQADDRAIYLAAYNWYAKAGDAKMMATAKKLFPSKEEIFVLNYKKGDKIRVDCWINEEVVIATRD